MDDLAFKPAGVAMAAVIASLGASAQEAGFEVDAPESEEARAAAAAARAQAEATEKVAAGDAVAYASLPAYAPLGAEQVLEDINRDRADQPLATPVQLDLPLEG